jgi:hypothetical protein
MQIYNQETLVMGAAIATSQTPFAIATYATRALIARAVLLMSYPCILMRIIHAQRACMVFAHMTCRTILSCANVYLDLVGMVSSMVVVVDATLAMFKTRMNV